VEIASTQRKEIFSRIVCVFDNAPFWMRSSDISHRMRMNLRGSAANSLFPKETTPKYLKYIFKNMPSLSLSLSLSFSFSFPLHRVLQIKKNKKKEINRRQERGEKNKEGRKEGWSDCQTIVKPFRRPTTTRALDNVALEHASFSLSSLFSPFSFFFLFKDPASLYVR